MNERITVKYSFNIGKYTVCLCACEYVLKHGCMCVCTCVVMCVFDCICMCVCVCVCVCVCLYQTDSLINLSLCVGPVDLGCHTDGNQVGPGNGLSELI